MKITIIGSSGGGKSTLARKINDKFAIPRLEIDRLWFSFAGHKVTNDRPEEKQVVQEKISGEVEKFLESNHDWVVTGRILKSSP